MNNQTSNSTLAKFALWLGRLRTIYLGLGIVGLVMIQIVGLRLLGLAKILGLYEPLHWNNYWVHLLWLTVAALLFLTLEQFIERQRPGGRGWTWSGAIANFFFGVVVFALIFMTG